MSRRVALTEETKGRIDRQHRSSVSYGVAAEALGLALLRPAIHAATGRIVEAAATASDPRSAVFGGVAAETKRMHDDLAEALGRTRFHGRALAMLQTDSELGEVQAFARQAWGDKLVLPAVVADLSTATQDAAFAAQTASSMTTRWSALTLAAFQSWKKSGAGTTELARALGSVRAAMAPNVAMNAATQAFDAYGDEHRAAWARVVGLEAKRSGKGFEGDPWDGFPSGPEQGLPYGWSSGVFDVWSAILDRKTCPTCWGLDGSMVPLGRPWPGVGRMPVHPLCRCVPVTTFIPEAIAKQLPGFEIDYSALKADIREHMLSSDLNVGVGTRHSRDYLAKALLLEGAEGSPKYLTRKLLDQRGYFPHAAEKAMAAATHGPKKATAVPVVPKPKAPEVKVSVAPKVPAIAHPAQVVPPPVPISAKELIATRNGYRAASDAAQEFFARHPDTGVLVGYTALGYASINQVLRAPLGAAADKVTQVWLDKAARLKALLADAKAAGHAMPGVVVRGESLRGMPASVLAGYKTAEIGSMLTFDTFLSASVRVATAKGFSGGGVVMRLRHRSGVPVRSVSMNPHEDEVLIPSGTTFRVVGRKVTSSRVVLDLEEVDK